MASYELTIKEAVDHLSEYLGRVSAQGDTFIIKDGNMPIAELRPLVPGKRLAELPKILASLPHLTPEEAEDFGRDIDEARASLREVRNPWDS